MAKIISASTGTKFAKSATLSNFSFTASAVARDRLVSSASTTLTTTTQDINFANITSAVTDHEFDVALTVPLSQILSVTNLTPSIISFTGQSATRIADGSASLVLNAVTCARRVDFAVSRTGGTTTNAFNSFVTGSLGKHLSNSIASLLSGKTAPTYTNTGSSYSATSTISDIFPSGVRNTSGWWGTTDITCIPQSVGTNGVLVTPRDMIYANHYGATNPTFRDNSGNTYSRSVVSYRLVGGSGDILAVTLNADLPSAIKPAKVLPSNWRTYLPNSSYGYPCLYTNQDRRLLLMDTNNPELLGNLFDVGQSMDAARRPWFYTVRSGDSGSPAFMLINGDMVALLTWWYVGAGPPLTDNISAINTAFAANGSPYSLTTANLSGFTAF